MGEDQYTITLDSERGLIRVVAQGELVKEAGEEIVTKARTIAVEHQYNILCDVRQAKVIVSLADWFLMPRRLAIFKDAKARFLKKAILITPGIQEEDYKFYETVTHNLGLNLMIFFGEEDALEWLKETK